MSIPKKNHGHKNDFWEENSQKLDEKTFEILFKKYYRPLTRFAWRYVKSKGIAEELVQELFTVLWEKRNEYDMRTEESFRAYLYKSTKNLALNHLKHQKIKEKYESEWTDKKKISKIVYKENYLEKKIQNAIADAVEQLPTRSKMKYKLHRYDGLTYEEIAVVMEVSVKTVESQMTRTLKKLRMVLSHLL